VYFAEWLRAIAKWEELTDDVRDKQYNAQIMTAETMLCLRKNRTVEQLINQLHNIRGEKL